MIYRQYFLLSLIS